MGRYVKRVFSGAAVLVGCLFSFVIGFIMGAAAGLMLQSLGIGALVGGIMFLFSLDVIFRGSE